MICGKWSDMRARFADIAAPFAPDGLPQLNGGLDYSTGAFSNSGSDLRGGGFSSSWRLTTAGGAVFSPGLIGAIGPLIAGAISNIDPLFPLTITIDGGASDGGTDSYAWYLSQRSDGLRFVLSDGTLSATGQPQYFTIAHPDGTHSGTVAIGTQSAQISALFPGSGGVAPTDAASLATLFNDCALYVSRFSDHAYQWARFVAPPVG